jgi:three-Cys-motif partner protein
MEVLVSANEEFFRERRAQAVLKHGILSRYPVVFASKTGWGGRSVMFLDGYAGRGEYEDGTKGSPALLAETAAKVASFRQVTGIYIEKSVKDFANLQHVMARYDRPNDQVLCGDLRDHLPEVLNASQGAALFAFLDPFGTALDRDQIAADLLCRQDTAPVEVLLHISVSTVARLGGLLRRRRLDGVELSPTDQKTIAHADRFLGGEWWRAHFEPVHDAADEERATEAAMKVARDYEAGIRADTGTMAVSMPIRPKPTDLPKYVLVLFTRHIDGLWYFADAVGKAGREWQGAWRAAVARKERAKLRAKHADDLGLFDVEEVLPVLDMPDFEKFGKQYELDHRLEWEQGVEANIHRVFTQRGPFVLAKRVDDVYGTLLGAASERHAREAVKALHRKGIIANTGVGPTFYRELLRSPS